MAASCNPYSRLLHFSMIMITQPLLANHSRHANCDAAQQQQSANSSSSAGKEVRSLCGPHVKSGLEKSHLENKSEDQASSSQWEYEARNEQHQIQVSILLKICLTSDQHKIFSSSALSDRFAVTNYANKLTNERTEDVIGSYSSPPLRTKSLAITFLSSSVAK